MPSMETREYTVRFLTPAFLGNAEQSGQWRTPPFKALLRQWWRVAVAAEYGYDVDRIRRCEGELFGVAADAEGGTSLKSRVRIRLEQWRPGQMSQFERGRDGRVQLGKNSISASLYLGYGPVVPGPRLKGNAAIQAEESQVLRLAFPGDPATISQIDRTLALIDRYGTLGGRCRNGWGSLELSPGPKADEVPLVDWESAMNRDWAHGIGKDADGPLIWRTRQSVASWDEAIAELARVRADMRRCVPNRLMLAYPDTKGAMPGWKKDDRVPHSLRFKVRSEGKEFYGVIVHVPCRPADVLWRKLNRSDQGQFHECFAAAHRYLEDNAQLPRLAA